MTKNENDQKGYGEPYEMGPQIDLGYEILRLFSLSMSPRFFNIEPKVISFPRSRLLMGQSAPYHLGVEFNGGHFKQVFAISRNVQELIVAHACVSFMEACFQGQPAVFRLTR
jgi:hypothetical protein